MARLDNINGKEATVDFEFDFLFYDSIEKSVEINFHVDVDDLNSFNCNDVVKAFSEKIGTEALSKILNSCENDGLGDSYFTIEIEEFDGSTVCESGEVNDEVKVSLPLDFSYKKLDIDKEYNIGLVLFKHLIEGGLSEIRAKLSNKLYDQQEEDDE